MWTFGSNFPYGDLGTQAPSILNLYYTLGTSEPFTSNQELRKENTASHMGGFHGPGLDMVYIIFVHGPLAGILSNGHI